MATEHRLSFTANEIDNKLGKIDKIEEDVKASVANWEQNDEKSPDYIKNRPFYSEGLVETDIIPSMEYTFVHEDDESGTTWAPLCSSDNTIVEGKAYTVVWNDVVYECVGVNFDGDTFIGNPKIWADDYIAEDNGMPFCIYLDEEELWCGVYNPEVSVTVNVRVFVVEEKVHKIDKKYLPTEQKSYVIEYDEQKKEIVCDEEIFKLSMADLATHTCAFIKNKVNGDDDVYLNVQQVFSFEGNICIGFSYTDFIMNPFEKTIEVD